MPKSYQEVTGDIRPLSNDILVVDMEQGFGLSEGGIILMNDAVGAEANIKPRWCRVYKVGSKVDTVKPDEWILVAHGRWTYGITLHTANGETLVLQKIDPKDILLVSDVKLSAIKRANKIENLT